MKVVPPLRTKWNTKWLLKSCPRCGMGDLHLSPDEDYVWAWVCVQCSGKFRAVATEGR